MDFMNLAARLTLDTKDYDEGINKADKSAQSFSKKFGGALKTVAKIGAVAIGAGVTAVGFLSKQAVSAYAEYEQLAGGVKKLFGDASDDVMKFANNAYKTSGMSANQYMEQATSFSAALINSLGGDTKKAAEQVDVAMRAMSDNVNTFGTDMASVQAAFQGFSKQNYTMLDNLKLGYGGTRAEMLRLIADANEYAAANGKAADLSIESFSDIVTAIELVQEKQGIAGTTAKEAATTIEGAFNMTKAAWENLVAGLANPDADLNQLMDNLIVALVGDKKGTGLLNNLIPAIQRALEGIGKLIAKAGPVIGQNLPGLFGSLVPSLISAATSLVISLAKALPGIAKVLVAQIPMIAGMLLDAFMELAGDFSAMGGNLMQNVFNGIKKKTPRIASALSSIGESFKKIVGKIQGFWAEHGQEIYNKAVEIFDGIKIFAVTAITLIAEGIDKFIQIALALWNEFGDEIMGYLTALKDFYTAVFQSISATIKGFVEWAKEFWAEYGDEITAATQTAWEIISTVIHTVLQVITGIVKTLTAIIQGDWQSAFQIIQDTTQVVWDAISSIFSTVLGVIQKVVSVVLEAIRKKISSIFNSVKKTISSIWNNIKTIISNALNNVRTTVSNAMTNVRTTISNAWENAKKAVSDAVENIKSNIQEKLDAAKKTVSDAMTNVRTTISNAWENAKKAVSDAVENIKSNIQEKFQAAYEKVSSIFGDIHDKIQDKMDAAKELVDSAVSKIKGLFPIKLGKIFKGVKLPHFKISGGEIPWGIGGAGKKPSVDIEWYRKAYDNPYLFSAPTVITGMGFGDGSGAEMVYGHENLMNDIRQVVSEIMQGGQGFTQNITINSPQQLNPSEVARQTRNQTRTMLMRMRTT